jgi:hypothetical protein
MTFTGKVEWILPPKKERVYLIKQEVVVSNDTDTIPFRLIAMGKKNNLHLSAGINQGDNVTVDYNIDTIQKGGDFWPKILVNNIIKNGE